MLKISDKHPSPFMDKNRLRSHTEKDSHAIFKKLTLEKLNSTWLNAYNHETQLPGLKNLG